MPNQENLTSYTKGQSGNPAGRPKGARNRATVVRELLALTQEILNPITGQTEELSQEHIITLAQINKARKGDTNAYKALMDSAHGAPKQQVETDLTLKNKPAWLGVAAAKRDAAEQSADEQAGS